MAARGRGRGAKRRARAAKLESGGVAATAASGAAPVAVAPDDADADAATARPEPEPEAMPVVPRTNATRISAAAIDQALAAASDAVTGEPSEARTTVDPSTLRGTKDVSDRVSLPRTTSDEWMAADADDGAYEQGPRRPRWLIPAVGAGIVAIGVVVIVAFGGNRDSAPRPTIAAHERRVDAATPTPDAAAPVAVAPVAVAVVAADAAELVDAAMDATELAVVPLDAPPVAAAPPDAALVVDAGTRVAAVPIDAAVAKPASKPDTTDAAVAKPVSKPDTTKATVKPKVPAPPADERTIEQLVDASEFAKANTACASNTMFSTPRLVACAIAACSTHSDALAARWIRAIPRASRDDIVAKCKSLGVEVAIP